jgi:putative ABC transport system permease protein
MNRMIVANLTYRPLRSLISIVAVAVEVILILLIVGLATGMLNDSKRRTQGTGADVVVRPPGSSNIIGFTGAPVSAKVADLLRKQPHVVAVSPVAAQFIASGSLEVIYGIDLPSFEAVGGPFQYLEGGPFQGPNEMLVDDYFAAANKVHVGQNIEVLNHQFRLAGIVENGRGARRFIPLKTMQDLISAENKASLFYVKLDDPANAETVARQIKQIPGMQDYSVMSMREMLSLMTPEKIPALAPFIKVVVGISMVIGFIVIFQSMYTAVMERTREIGILKSLGASKLYIVRVILRETLLLSILGIILGMIISFAARPVLAYRFPTLPVEITGGWLLRATIVAIVGAMLGAVYPAFKAAQKDPIDALAYE